MDDRAEGGHEALQELGRWLRGTEVIQLGHQLRTGMPRYPSQPPFTYSLTGVYGEQLGRLPGQDPRVESIGDMFSMGVHTGTHQDSLAHTAFDGKLRDGTDYREPGAMDHASGVRMRTTPENMGPVVAPGVLLDFPAFLGVEAIPVDYPMTPEALTACARAFDLTIDEGDVVLLRTGWDTKFHSAAEFMSSGSPGPTSEAARMLVELGVVATGSDTMAYEPTHAEVPLDVHNELLFKGGVYIFETMDLRHLSARRAYRFLFVSAPLRILGQTGSPVCPLAIVPAAATS